MRSTVSLLILASVATLSGQDLAEALKAANQTRTQDRTSAEPQPLALSRASLLDQAKGSAGQDPAKGSAYEDQERFQAEIAAARAKEKAPKRFAEDLFTARQSASTWTEGGISDDYVLGAGDQVQLSAFGSATFELPLTVDGRGQLVVPKVGSVKVGGLSLSRARAAVQSKVAQQFSRTSVDLSVTKLREIRIAVLGEVYRPGTYLVPSLSSLVNVLGLAGGPTAAGSFREIRVMRGGAIVHKLDLYPLRAEGLGNVNFALQSGDTVFVPLAFNQVTLEGAFTRVVAATGDLRPVDAASRKAKEEKDLKERIALEEARLKSVPALNANAAAARAKALVPTIGADGTLETPVQGTEAAPLDPDALEANIKKLKERLKELQTPIRGDQRLEIPADKANEPTERDREFDGFPGWLIHWKTMGAAPRLQFEMLPGETAADALRYAGGLALEASQSSLTLRRLTPGGVIDSVQVPVDGAAGTPLRRGDILSAFATQGHLDRTVSVNGWIRVPGLFSRAEGLRVGDLLKRENQILPDTYLARGEIIRFAPDQTTSYLAFDVAKALAGDPGHNVPLQDRDRVELYRTVDMRLARTVEIIGPVARPGTYAFHEGMRASDLLFQAGIPQREANRFVAELAHTRDGIPSEVRKLDLSKLLSDEGSSPIRLEDEAVNPLIKPWDQLSIYGKPDYRAHRTVTLIGQVNRPGIYTLDKDRVGIREIIARAGGLTPEAMPKATIFLRPLRTPNPNEFKAEDVQNGDTKAPNLNGINSVLERLSETKRHPNSGALLRPPLLHGLGTSTLDRLVVNIPAIMSGDPALDVDLQDGDKLIIPKTSDSAYIIGETASPFMSYHVKEGMKVKEVVIMAGGFTRNADKSNLRLLKADGRILDSSVMGQPVEPGDAILVPQRIQRDMTWVETVNALTPLALLLNAIKVR
ncbi:polysaccharide biosynthesis/export family protein [Mesoterricola sediminis]|uniref:Uncharacterized protein n=1 Tax=Mesoterricola sediminis TaxID=2927980 RepID=A0AA48HBL2_9BACT|nr:SLBB domain-containing protein [Mesoterricola sediminis]BDU75303.1 hypothetical protein METESE_02610 [Mesoterricola sediminis]